MREVDVPMPKLSMTMAEGELIEWRKQEGEPVSAGEVICEVLSDKVEMEVESPAEGTLLRHRAAEGEMVAVGAPIATIATEAEDLIGDLLARSGDGAASSADATPETAAEPAPETEAFPESRPAAEPPPAPPARKGPRPAVPAARRRAAELGVDLDQAEAGGADGVVRLADVERAAAKASEEPARAAPAAPAERAERAERAVPAGPGGGVPQLTVFVDADLEALAARRGALGWSSVLVIAAARALRANPRLNSVWRDGGVVQEEAVRVAVAVDGPDGLVAPVVDDPDRTPADRLAQRLRRLADRARRGRLEKAELEGATFTLSNLGALGADAFQAPVTSPQVATLSVGVVAPRAVVRDGATVTRTVVARLGCRLGLSVDQRVADGADAARYLADLRELLEDPDRLLRPAG
jgi:pyruvate dehydrogenase E2 component (dihydrolipoamide acetyltransferase)